MSKLWAGLGLLGCFIAFMSAGLMFFGVESAFWGGLIGVSMGAVSLIN